MTQPFIIYALPRSRTVWLSKFLTYGGWICHHDPLAKCNGSIEKVSELLKKPFIGIVDTGLVAGWRKMRELVPEAKIITVRRDPEAVRESLKIIRWDFPIIQYHQALDEVEKEPDICSIKYEDLSKNLTCLKLLQHCTGHFDSAWADGLQRANIQLNMERLPFLKSDVTISG